MNCATLGWTVDELARRARVTTRTIRAHQTVGLLPPPVLVARTAYYGEQHLQRLGAIGRLQARGWSRAAIRDALAAWEAGHNLEEVLGLQAALTRAGDWVDELFAAYVAPSEPGGLLPAPLAN
jgi:DNA-binding transcriptional MerR regulator